MDALSDPVVRDAKGRVVKGSTLNAGGYTTREARMMRDLRALGPRAIAKLGKLLDSPVESVALGAAKEILDRNLGKSRQSVTVDVTSTHVLHLEALQLLSDRRRAQMSEAQVIDNAANTVSHSSNTALDRIGLHGDSTLALSADDYSVSMGDAEPPRPPDDRGAAAYAPPTPDTHQNPTTPQDDTP